MSMPGIWIGLRSDTMKGEVFWFSSKWYCRVTMHQMPPASNFSNSRTYESGTSASLMPRLESSASYESRFSLSLTVTLSITLNEPRSRILLLTFSASSGRT